MRVVKVVAIIQARMTSTRLPGKVMKKILGKTLLELLLERVQLTSGIDEIVVASPFGKEHDDIEKAVQSFGNITFIRGDEHDVLARYHKAALATKTDIVIRITSDCPLYDYKIVSSWLELFKNSDISYLYAPHEKGYPLGLGAEILTFDALNKAFQEAKDPYEREHVTPYIWRRPTMFPSIFIEYKPDLYHCRLAVDEEADFQFVREIYERLYIQNPQFVFAEIKDLLSKEPELLKINQHIQQKPLIPLGAAYG